MQAAAADYIARHGIRAFMDEDYNLTGSRVRVVATGGECVARIGGWARCRCPATTCPSPSTRCDLIQAAIDGPAPATAQPRADLARFFADPANAPGLSMGQRMYLEWHYRSPNNYSFTLEKPLPQRPGGSGGSGGGDRVMGWNQETELTGGGDFVFFTGLLGCTGICAIADDGAAYMSHWDEVCNPRQLDGYARFAARHPDGTVHVIGVTSQSLAAGLRERHANLDIRYHSKKIYYERTYMVRFARTAGRVAIAVCESDVTDDYVSSTHNGEYGRWFPYGRFSQAYPGADAEFRPCTVERLR